MGVVENMKEVADLIKKIGDIDLNRRILKLEEEVIDLSRDKRRAEEKVEALESELKIRKQLVFRNDQYFLKDGDKEDGPFCSLCWDRHHTLVRFHVQSAFGAQCPACVQDRITAKHK